MGNKLNLTKKILKLPLAILFSPLFATDWEDQKDIANTKRFLKSFFW